MLIMGIWSLAIAAKRFWNYVNHLAGMPVDQALAQYAVE